MAITVGTRAFKIDAGGTSRTFTSITVPSPCKIIAFLAIESATETGFTSVTFNSVSMTQFVAVAMGSTVLVEGYYLDYSGAAGSHTLACTSSDGGPQMSCVVWPLEGAASGAPEAYTSDTESTSSNVVGDATSITCSAGAFLGAIGFNGAASNTVTLGGGATTLGDDDTATGARHSNAADIQASGGSKSVTWTYSGNTGHKIMVAVSVAAAGGAAPLSITSVTPSSFDSGRTGIVIAGTGFGASQGSSTLTIGGVAQTVTAWSDTSITFTAVRSSQSMGNATLTVTKV